MEYVLLIECEDKEGLIYNITGALFRHGCNIIRNAEFADRERNLFFMRTEFIGEINIETLLKELKSVLPENSYISLNGKDKKDIVLLVTKEYHCLGDLLHRNEFDEINGRIKAVISNHEDLSDLVTRHSIPFHYISHKNVSREEHEKNIEKILDIYMPQYIILAKYMRIFTSSFVKKYDGKLINIHHSFLPAFIGANPYKQAYERGVKIIGATAHFVTDNLDEGPIITQSIIPVNHSFDSEDMVKAGRDVEKMVLAQALNLVLEDRVFVNKNKTIIFK